MKRSLRSWLWRVPVEQEVDEELALHVEMRRREGRPLNDADIEQVRRACLAIARKRDREMRLLEWFGDVREDVRFAVRQMRTSVGFTLVATVTLALGIGANSAIFALADATLLRPLPFRESDRLVSIVERIATAPHAPVSIPTFEDVRNQSRSFDGLAAIQMGAGGGPLVTGPDGTVEAVERQSVSTTLLRPAGRGAGGGPHLPPVGRGSPSDGRRFQRKPLAWAFPRRRVPDRTHGQIERRPLHARGRRARPRAVHAPRADVDTDRRGPAVRATAHASG